MLKSLWNGTLYFGMGMDVSWVSYLGDQQVYLGWKREI